MKYRNNLSDSCNNSWFKIIKPFSLLIAVGTYDANTFIGSTQLCGIMYEKVSLNYGDYLADLFGGVFVMYKNKMHHAKMHLSDKSPFEKSYSITEEIFPTECLELCSPPELELEFVTNLPKISAPNSFFERSVDSIKNI